MDDDHHEFKPILSEIVDRPVNPLGRTMFWAIVFLMLIIVTWTAIGEVDVVVTARGTVIPKGNVKVVQALDTGVIKHIHVNEGDYVEKDQVLMSIDTATTAPALNSLQERLDQTKLEISALKALSEDTDFIANLSLSTQHLRQLQNDSYVATLQSLKDQTETKKLELSKIIEQLGSIESQKTTIKESLSLNVKKRKRLYKVLDIIPIEEYSRVKELISQQKAKLKELDFQSQELSHQTKQINSELSFIKEKFKSDTLAQLLEKEKECTQLEAQIQEATFINAKQRILSPVDGYVVSLGAHTIGGVVTPAQKIMSIVPKDSELVIQAFVQNQDIGFVKKALPVKLKIDTFSFQKYGFLTGEVSHISNTSIEDEKRGQIYEIFIKPLTDSLMVAGKREFLSTGLSLTAEINVGKRRIFEFFIYPLIKYMDEGMSVR